MKHIKKITALLAALAAIAGTVISGCAPSIGKLPSGDRLARISMSPHYRDGRFHSLEPTRIFTGQEGGDFSMLGFLLGKGEGRYPGKPLPLAATDLKALPPDRDAVVWLGHSSIYLQIGGKRILLDPVLGKNAGPFGTNKAFIGDYPWAAADLPDIDCLIISHDHWDHLEYPTMKAIKDRVGAVVCPLGVGSHLEYWGFDPAIIHEGDWDDTITLGSGLSVRLLPARHSSGRWIRRDKTFWASFLIESPSIRIFYSGDGGYGKHFAEIGEKHGGMDLALMECGQYNLAWHAIHMLPEEMLKAADDIKAKHVIPVHSGRFSIAPHPWQEPYERMSAEAPRHSCTMLTPRIGEPVFLDALDDAAFTPWWEH
ncbi:MAG: MBL fold metallo-hydrolase [Mailhella sp.]|nr:MBL fold metallo-hydrolase [Mailhella sp.]